MNKKDDNNVNVLKVPKPTYETNLGIDNADINTIQNESDVRKIDTKEDSISEPINFYPLSNDKDLSDDDEFSKTNLNLDFSSINSPLSDTDFSFDSYDNNQGEENDFPPENNVVESSVQVNNDISLTDNKFSKDKFYFSYELRFLTYIIAIVLCTILSCVFLMISISHKSKTNLTYKQTSNLDYKVYLKPNNYYNEKYLNKDMQYIASLIDYIKIDFNYNFKMNYNIDYKYSYYIKSNILVTDKSDKKKVIYTKEDKLTEDKIMHKNNSNEFNIKEEFNIDYAKYNNLIKQFKSEYGINANSSLDLSLIVDVTDEKGNKVMTPSDDNVMKISIPLTEQMINIGMDYKEINNSDNAEVYQEYNISNKVLFGISIVFMVGSLSSVVMLVLFLIKTTKKKTPYEILLSKILKEYDRVIINSKKNIILDGEVVDVNSFEELLDVRDNLEKPILFYEIHKGQKSLFVVKSGNISYRYVLKLADLENKKNSN